MTRRPAGFAALAVALVCAALPAVAGAQPGGEATVTPAVASGAATASAERPWALGVSPDKQKLALERLQEGNMLVKESLFAQAVDKYREALAAWDHPGIHYNLALALLNLDRPFEVHEHLESALKFGAAPLDKDKFDHARSYLALIEKQLAVIDIQCEFAGATVSLDGRVVFQAPGRYKSLIRPGPHTVTAAKVGFSTTERTKVLLPGEPTVFHLNVYSPGELIGYRRRWPVAEPVLVTAAGGAFLIAGAILSIEARDRFKAFDDQVRNDPTCTMGCLPSSDLTSIRDRGHLYQNLAAVSYAVGGVALAGGALLLYMNRSIPYRIDPSERGAPAGGGGIDVAPMVGMHEAGLVGTARF
jgi:hypothetical protein